MENACVLLAKKNVMGNASIRVLVVVGALKVKHAKMVSVYVQKDKKNVTVNAL